MENRNEMERRYDERMRVRNDNDDVHRTAAMLAVGGLALLGLAAILLVALPDIKRYIKISTM